MIKKSSCGYDPVKHQLINIYTDENPLLTAGEVCYFLFWSVTNYHIPFVGSGVVQQAKFSNSFDMEYIISFDTLCHDNDFAHKYFYGQTFEFEKGKTLKMSPKYMGKDMKLRLRVSGFFVRGSIEEVVNLYKFYIGVLESNLYKKLDDIREVKNWKHPLLTGY